MNAVIFGIHGQDGHYLNELCKERGVEVIGVSRSPGNWLQGDVSNFPFVKKIIRKHKPDYIFHLAASSSTRHDTLFENHKAISDGAINILESVKRYSPESRVFITGSGTQFVNTGLPIAETDPFEARDPYSLARIHSVYAARYFRTLGVKVYVGYLFHHDSPYRTPDHVSRMIADHAKKIAAGNDGKITLGDISVEKEWMFAGDVVRGMFTLIDQDKVTETVIGSGVAYTIERWLDECFGIIGKDWRDCVCLRESFVPEYRRLVSDPKTIRSLGWSPRVTITELAEMMVLGR